MENESNKDIVDEIRDITSLENTAEIMLNMKKDITRQDIVVMANANRIKNPFRMIGLETVMRDLKVCRNVAYKVFQRDDFPSINIGKTKQVMLLAYILWKMDRKGW